LISLPDTETITETDDDGNSVTRANPRGLAYAELIAPLIGAVKALTARIEALEA